MTPESILAEFGQQQVLGFMLVLARVSPLFLLAPLFSSKMIPARARGSSRVKRVGRAGSSTRSPPACQMNGATRISEGSVPTP